MSLKISRILHAGYVFEYHGVQILMDPIFENPFSKNCYAFPNVKFDLDQIRGLKPDAIFISHFHDDHCSLESLNFLDRGTPIYFYCLHPDILAMIRELGFENVHALEVDQCVSIGDLQITCLKALDTNVDSMFHIRAHDLNILNVVDSLIDPISLKELSATPWDLVLWPFQTMLETDVLSPSRAEAFCSEIPAEFREQLQILKPRHLVPSSCQFIQEPWSWYNHAMFPVSYLGFAKEIEKILPQTQVVKMNPGAGFVLDKKSFKMEHNLSWVIPLGNQELDFDYRKKTTPPTTAEIAQHFEALTEAETKTVLDYCCHGIFEKFKILGPSDEEYFRRSRRWKLSIYDPQGKAQDFYYLIKDDHLEADTLQEGPIAWITQVPAVKIYGALERGESLTSMYMRINDQKFEDKIEKEIQWADVLQDPLIRCLFTGNAGNYQKFQLKKLKSCGQQ